MHPRSLSRCIIAERLWNFFEIISQNGPISVKWKRQFQLIFCILRLSHKHNDFNSSRGTPCMTSWYNFILSNQDNKAPTAILACIVDFSKAFNRQNHNILITKFSEMGVPVWLLRIVMSFLEGRTMVVRHKGATSSSRALPGGGPQGTLLGLLLFIVLINDVGFKNQKNNTG